MAGVDPADLADVRLAERALENVGFLVSFELRNTAVARRADVVFPVAPVVEKSGTFLDWEASAVRLARESAYAAGHARVATVVADWRTPPPLAPFDLVLAADVLYEARNAPGVAGFLGTHLLPGARALVCDPGRRHAEGFDDDLARVGLVAQARHALGAREEARRVTLLEVGRA